jgi:hypothetical protein
LSPIAIGSFAQSPALFERYSTPDVQFMLDAEIGAVIPILKDKGCWSWLKIAFKKVLEKSDE